MLYFALFIQLLVLLRVSDLAFLRHITCITGFQGQAAKSTVRFESRFFVMICFLW